MKTAIIGLIGLISVSVAQKASVNGIVKDRKGNPLPGVIVSNAQWGAIDTTDAAGVWSLVDQATPVLDLKSSGLSWNGKELSGFTSTPQSISLQIFDMNGSLLQDVPSKYITQNWSISISGAITTKKNLILRFTEGSNSRLILLNSSNFNPIHLTKSVQALGTLGSLVYNINGRDVLTQDLNSLPLTAINKFFDLRYITGSFTPSANATITKVKFRNSNGQTQDLSFDTQKNTYSGWFADAFDSQVAINDRQITPLAYGANNTIIAKASALSTTLPDDTLKFAPVSADNALPSLIATPSVTTADQGSTVSFTVNASDALNGTISSTSYLNNGTWTTFTGNTLNLTMPSTGSTYNWSIKAIDNDGNEIIKTGTITLTSNILPTLSVSPTNSTAHYGDVVNLTVTTNDADGTIAKREYTTDGITWTTFTGSTLALTMPNSGSVLSWTIRVTDDRGGKAEVYGGINISSQNSSGQYRDRTRLIGYYPNYASTLPTVAQAQKLSHLMYFSIPLTTGTTNGAIDSRNYLNNMRVKAIIDTAHKGGAKAIAVFGGAGISLSEFALTANSAAGRAAFAHNCADFVKQMNMDGVDIDWEFPNFPAAYSNYVGLLKALKDTLAVYSVAMGKTLELSTAVHPDHASYFDVNLANAVDFINIMTYDLGVPHAPANAASVYLPAFANRGIPKAKLAIGVPFYGKVGNDGPTALSWTKLVNAGCAVTADQCAVASAGGKTYDFNGTTTIANKAKYSLDNGYGGVLIWDISMDLAPNDPRSLLNVLSQVQ